MISQGFPKIMYQRRSYCVLTIDGALSATTLIPPLYLSVLEKTLGQPLANIFTWFQDLHLELFLQWWLLLKFQWGLSQIRLLMMLLAELTFRYPVLLLMSFLRPTSNRREDLNIIQGLMQQIWLSKFLTRAIWLLYRNLKTLEMTSPWMNPYLYSSAMT